jgi:hypothetical protein
MAISFSIFFPKLVALCFFLGRQEGRPHLFLIKLRWEEKRITIEREKNGKKKRNSKLEDKKIKGGDTLEMEKN